MVDKANLVIIPARKNSKRLPGKNLLKVGGISLLDRTINYARNGQSKWMYSQPKIK